MRRATWLGIALFFATAGCAFNTTPVAVVPLSTLVVEWTINGGKDPNACSATSSAAIQITVTFTNGAPAGTFQQACTAFATSITLNPRNYSATAELVDTGGTPRTTSVQMNPFFLNPGDVLNIPIDFPTSSFYGPA